jgi:hypothetical protein
LTVVIKLKSIKNGWESILIELHVNNGTDNWADTTGGTGNSSIATRYSW